MRSDATRESALGDRSTSFWIRRIISQLDKLDNRDPVDAIIDLQWVKQYVDELLDDREKGELT